MKWTLSILILIVSVYNTLAQSKYEFRGVWVATIGGIDWPKPSTHKDMIKQQQDFIIMLDRFKSCGINAVIFQVRPSADAFYKSNYEAWSKYLTGYQGQDPLYDPLQFAINEAHKRNMELHAWLNPYRALIDAKKNINPPNHATHTHPEWFVNYGGKKYFDPGIPAVQNYLINVVKDIVAHYDIDAIHMDDYFYPYKIGKADFPDQESYMIYGSSYTSKADWRRNNINKLVEELAQVIKQTKNTVKFGISPFGVWRNITQDARGSNTTAGTTNYDDLYADILLWLQKGWIDYVMPQLYWEQGHKAADYYTLLDWWSKNTYGKSLYIGHGLYQMESNKKPQWKGTQEITEQILLNRQNKNVHGSCYYSANAFEKNKYGITQQMQLLNTKQALVPPMKWIKTVQVPAPEFNLKNIAISIKTKENIKHIIYAVPKGVQLNINNAEQIETVLQPQTSYYSLQKSVSQYDYYIACIDRISNESIAIKIK
jgi:uncharacterized lipoprotein YddW (UPF0748 family)